MVTQLPTKTERAPAAPGRAQEIWLLVMQLVPIALLVLALCWAVSPDAPHLPPAAIYRKFLAGLALLMFIVAVIPKWRHGEVAGVLGGAILATACWLAAGHVLSAPSAQKYISSGDIPTLTPIIMLIAVLALFSGLLLRAGVFGESRVGRGALAAGLLLSAWAACFYGLLRNVPAFKLPELGYGFSSDQMQEILAVIILFSLALWLGGVGIRRQGRWLIQPIGMVLVLACFLLKWHFTKF